MVLQQLDNTVVHDGLRQHLELEELTDELDIADGTPSGLVLGVLQLFLKPLTLRRLRGTKERLTNTSPGSYSQNLLARVSFSPPY